MKKFLPFLLGLVVSAGIGQVAPAARPNILFAISDDQSYPHASAYGASGVETPNFDRVARAGVLFHNVFAAAPQCSPNRAAILTGQNIWRLKEAGTHGSVFPHHFPVFSRALEKNGYHVGYTGKPWAPGNWRQGGWDRNPVGDEYNQLTLDPPTTGIKDNDYAANFAAFLTERDSDQPFFFWYGASEPHLTYEYGSGLRAGKSLDDADLPPFLPDSPETRTDFLDYAHEIEWFDRHLGLMLDHLASIGELDNTIVVVTSDNGMPFPYAKANLQEFGTRVPLAISGPAYFPGARETRAIVSQTDFAPTFLELAGAPALPDATGRSLLPFLVGSLPHREHALTGRERHTHAREDNLGYPARAIRTSDHLLIWNMKPERWPAGNPSPTDLPSDQFSGEASPDFKSMGLGYADIDFSVTKKYLFENRERHPFLFTLAFQKRPEFQLFDVINDPWCLNDLARHPLYRRTVEQLFAELKAELIQQGDPRLVGKNPDIFESYPRFGTMRFFPGFKERGEYNPAFQD